MRKAQNSKIKVVVAMSGGVDSSVAAALLKQQGYDVVGAHMKFWSEAGKNRENRCCSSESEKRARQVAKKLGIPFYVFNFEKEFKKAVVDYFVKEYQEGRTPNPCVICNKEIKFGLLFKKALAIGADYIATGHYAEISLGDNLRSATNFFPAFGDTPFVSLRETSGPRPAKSSLPRFLPAGYASDLSPRLFVAKDKEKDQSYFLWKLDQKMLARVLFPIGGYAKKEVRKIAKKMQLPTAETPESQEVCFVDNADLRRFLAKRIKAEEGDIVDINGKIIGRHSGLCFYTIGQRKGIHIASDKPYYVMAKDLKNNRLVVTKNEKDLLKKELVVKNINWINGQPKFPIKISVKIRYRSSLATATMFGNTIKFNKPQRAITSGQSAVFYRGQQLLGGGIIK